jgi:hypothetical protein
MLYSPTHGSITYVLVSIRCVGGYNMSVGEYNMWWLVLHVLVSITCVGKNNIVILTNTCNANQHMLYSPAHMSFSPSHVMLTNT